MISRLRMILLLLFILISNLSLSQSKSQSSTFEVTSDLYNWTREMKRLDITTPERDLIFEITINNEDDSSPLTFEKLDLSIVVKNVEEQNPQYSKVYSQYIYIPAKQSKSLLFPVDLGYSQYNPDSNIGRYTVDLTYKYDYVDYIIEPSPYEFRIVSQAQFEKEIEEERVALIFVDLSHLTIPAGIVTTMVVAIVYGIVQYKKKSKEKND